MPQNTAPLPAAGTDPVFTFLNTRDLRASIPEGIWQNHPSIDYALTTPNDGVYVIDENITQKTKDIAAACTAAGKPFILGYTDLGLRTGVHAAADMDTLAEALRLTDKIAIGTSDAAEWSPLPGRGPGVWSSFAKDNGFTWVCPFIHVRLLADMEAKVTRDALAAANTPVFCLMGYALANYCLGKPLPPYKTSLMDNNLLRTHQLSLHALRDYLRPLYAISGAGGKQGMVRGTRRWVKQAGFQGVVFTGPATRGERDTMPAASRQPNDLSSYADLIVDPW
tara:strand:+ start:726 stop:1565 length:840 start_codon:yes stop_codon:yes gene_type:complete